MKTTLIFIFILIGANSFAQNEFAASAFYKEFMKIYNDAQQGFVKYKGAKKAAAMEELNDEFRVKVLLPLADSGKLVFPVQGEPYAEYYFQPSKKQDEINQRAANLRDAVITAFGKPLYSRSETTQVKKTTYSNTWFFAEPGFTDSDLAIFKSSIVGEGKNFILSFRIIGRVQ